MIIKKPKFWDEKIGIISIILYPLTLIVIILIFLKKKFAKSIKFEIPIICVGNIYLGGTGKTPTSIFLAKELVKVGKKPAILRKYYQDHSDEHGLIKKYFTNLILEKNRESGVKKAKDAGFDSVILDDGFQDYNICKDLNIICFNDNQLVGNGLILPSGPLRESLKSLKNADIVLINGKKNENFEKRILEINSNLKIFYSHYKPLNIEWFKNKELVALAGIGNPKNFFGLLRRLNFNIKDEMIYPDHYVFSDEGIKKILKKAESNDYHIIMTEKDYFKFKNIRSNRVNYLKVSLEIEQHEKFMDLVNKCYA